MKRQAWYKWVILSACFLLMAVPFSIVNAIHPLFMNPVAENLNLKISAFSLIFTISAVVAAITSPVIGKLLLKFKLKWIMALSAILVGGGFFCYRFAESITAFYFFAVFISIGMAGLTTIPISTMLVNWFGRQSGMAMGIAFAGAGSGTFMWMQWVSKWIEEYGYQQAYTFLGLIILLVALPICLFIVEYMPPKGDSEESVKQEQEKPAILKEAKFWLFALGLLFMGVAIAGTQIHVQSYLASLGYTISYGANIGSTLAMFGLSGNIVGGVLFDKMPTKFALGTFGTLNIVSLFLLFFAENSSIPYIFAAVFGVGLCLPSIWPAYGVGILFDRKFYSEILGMAQLFFAVGGAVGPFLSGVIADTVGYSVAWSIYLLLTIFYLGVFIVLISRFKKPV